jgi:hypothetical protein
VNLLGDPMLRMDALPAAGLRRAAERCVAADNGPLVSNSPTDSVALIAQVREETAVRTVSLAERDLVTGNVTP